MYVQRNIKARSCNRCYNGKEISITYSECGSVALCTQCEMRTRHIVICGLARSAEFFKITSHKWHDFRKRVIELKMCDLMFWITFV